ncbi:MAG: hypothetical protein EOO68_07760 [Moraxellaceae bacterium]|nr:MAG: hypothetical protein EOO68_07760 [Moraxellaceae bacterium]
MKLVDTSTLLRAVSVLTFITALCACNAENTPGSSYEKNGHFTQVRTYISDQPGGGRCITVDGCFAQMTFSPDGSGTIIFSDIANRVNYSIKKDTLTTTLEGQGDIPKTLKFDILDKAQSLVRQDTGTVFNLKVTTLAVYKHTGGIACEPGTGISISESEKSLKDAKIAVESSYCGYLANIIKPAVCGIPTDKVYVHLIEQDQLAAAQKLGFGLANADTASTITKMTCETK